MIGAMALPVAGDDGEIFVALFDGAPVVEESRDTHFDADWFWTIADGCDVGLSP